MWRYTFSNKGDVIKLNRRVVSCFMAATCVVTLLSGFKSKESAYKANNSEGKHEPITFMYSVGAKELIDAVHEKYPEINLVQIPYGGGNNSWYTASQMITGEMPDIYNSSMPWAQYSDKMQENLVELSGYDFTDNFLPTQIRDGQVDGKIYLLPCNLNVYGIVYNKTLFEKHGWSVPESFEELKVLATKIEAAGVNLAITNERAVGYDFQYLCNLADTLGLSDIEGIEWQRKFLKGEASAEEGFSEALDYMQEWVDLGMLMTTEQSVEKYGLPEDKKPIDLFAEGNTAFFIGNFDKKTQNADGTGDQYALIPYLSKDGTNNRVITFINRYWGINKKLEEPGNEQKLEDALHVMEVLSTVEGQKTLSRGGESLNTLLGISVEEDSPYYEVLAEINEGHSSPFIYDGWTGVLVNIGENVKKFCNGEQTKEETLENIDKNNQETLKKGVTIYAHADEVIDLETTTRLVGQAFCEKVDADCALISQDALREDGDIQNGSGASGIILPTDIDDEYLAVFTPGGRSGKIKTITLTGKRIKEVQEQGYDAKPTDSRVDPNLTANFPYVLVTKEGFELDDETEYTVVICGATDALKEEGHVVDTEVLGVTAIQEYFSKLENPMHITAKDIEWK